MFSSFERPKSLEIQKLLQSLDPPRRKHQSILYLATVNVKQLYLNIRDATESSTLLLDRYKLDTLVG
jgi:hypothetical protein